MRVFDIDLINGATLTRSLLNNVADPLKFVGTLQLAPADLADPSLSFELTIQRAVEPGKWECAGVIWWTGGQFAVAPRVEFDGVARRVRLLMDPSRTVPAGADISVF